MKKGMISQRFDLGTTVPRLVSEAKGIEEIEEKVAKVVFELGRGGSSSSSPGDNMI
jgi:hypothetical protein